MAKNFFKTIFNTNKDKNNIPKINKLTPNYNLSNLVTTTKKPDDIFLQQQQNIESQNLFQNYYSQKDEADNIMNSFKEKINKLNKKFYTCSEKFILSKTNMDKFSDELFLNLFKQIDCYVEEIQRLNKKITSIDDKENKIKINKLTKELSENKEKIRNYEIKLKEKTAKEEKLLKELESYKRRVIFFKNKININLMARNAGNRQAGQKNQHETITNTNNSILSKNSVKFYRGRRFTQVTKKNNKIRNFFSPSPEKLRHNKDASFLSSKNPCNEKVSPKKRKKITSSINSNTINNIGYKTISNFNKKINNTEEDNSNKNLINVHIKDTRSIFSDGDTDNSNRDLIKIQRKMKPKESIILPIDKNYNKDDDTEKNINIKENKEDIILTPKKALLETIKIYSPNLTKKNENIFEKLDVSKSLVLSDKEENDDKNKKNNKNDKIEKSYQKKNSFNIKNKSIFDKGRKNLNTTTSKKNSNLKSKIFNTNTNKKMINSKKIFNIPPKKFNKPNLKKSDNTKCNTSANINNKNIANNNSLEDIKNNTIDNFKQKSVKFKQDETFDNEIKLCYTSSGEENNDNSSINSFNNKEKGKKNKDFKKANNKTKSNNSGSASGNMSDTLSKGTNNNENLSSGNNSLILKKEKKLPSKKKPIMTKKAFKVSTKKQALSKSTIKIKKDVKDEPKPKEKEKEFAKLLKEMNEDYNNDIEMLKTQEEQIQLMLSLIDLNDDDD